MKALKKPLKVLAIIISVVIITGVLAIYFSVPSLPKGTDERIENVINSEIATLKGVEGFALNEDVKIWYNTISPLDSAKGSILLFMGIANDALAWPNYFLDKLVEEGYQVIRFDTRGTGMTDWVDNWSEENAYSLEDIANDAVAILDTLQIEKAHMLGVSLGGMIAQSFAIHHPERTLSLNSFMSSGDIMDSTLPSINTSLIKDLVLAQLKYGIINTEKNLVKRELVSRMLLMGETKYEINVEDVSNTVLYNVRFRKGMNPKASKQHILATHKSSSRYRELAQLSTPTLIVHGKSDPLINFSHGKKCASIIPNAQTLWIEGMGHDLPEIYLDSVVEALKRNFSRSNKYP